MDFNNDDDDDDKAPIEGFALFKPFSYLQYFFNTMTIFFVCVTKLILLDLGKKKH